MSEAIENAVVESIRPMIGGSIVAAQAEQIGDILRDLCRARSDCNRLRSLVRRLRAVMAEMTLRNEQLKQQLRDRGIKPLDEW